MTGRLLDTHAIAVFLARVAPLSGDALHEAFVCAALEGGGGFHVPAEGRAVLTLYTGSRPAARPRPRPSPPGSSVPAMPVA